MTDKAKLYFQQLIDMNYGGAADGARNYSMLAAVYNKENNTENTWQLLLQVVKLFRTIKT